MVMGRHAAANAQKLDVFDRAKPFQDGFETRIRKQQSIAAGQQDIANFGMRFEIAECSLHTMEVSLWISQKF